MKSILIKQFMLVALLFAGLAAAYRYYPPFAALFDDVVQYADMRLEQPESAKPSVAGERGVDGADMAAALDSKFAQPRAGIAEKTTAAQESPIQMPSKASQPAMTAYPAFNEPPPMQADAMAGSDQAAMGKSDGFRPLAPAPPAEIAQQSPPALKAAPPMAQKKPTQVVDAMAADKLPSTSAPMPQGPGTLNDEAAAHQALEGLAQARSAWQQGHAEQAIERYRKLMLQYPNHPDFAGELGNIYYAQGNRVQAVDAYAEAFQRLMRMQDYRRAWQLLAVVRKLDYRRAGQLERAFTGAH